jgi:hypothetical protein
MAGGADRVVSDLRRTLSMRRGESQPHPCSRRTDSDGAGTIRANAPLGRMLGRAAVDVTSEVPAAT